ncbi:MAG TPA: universal stress protein [Terriglobales bacterium]
MLEIKLILCPVDLSEFSIRAYLCAVSLAVHCRAQLVVQHIVELSRYPYADYVASTGDYSEFRRALNEGGKVRLREFVKKHPHDEIQPELVVHEGSTPDCLLSLAQKRKTDLIVMGTHGRRGYDRLVLGSVTNRVMRKTPCPGLAFCKLPHESIATGEERHHVHHLNRILFCTDFSENSELALHYATSATTEYDAELTLLHVLEDVPSPARMEDAIAAVSKQLDKLIPRQGSKALKIRRRCALENHTSKSFNSSWMRKSTRWLWSTRPWRTGSGGVWFDHLSSTAVGNLSRSRRRPLNC